MKEQVQTVKNSQNCLKAKVDSMDNSYDKRISNLEAVITPVLATQMSQKHITETVQVEIQSYFNKNITSLIDDKLKLLSVDKDTKLVQLEQEIS